ncbi:hypothetical protein PGB90_009216 [Kerria lacca]
MDAANRRYYLKVERPVYQIDDVETAARKSINHQNSIYDDITEDSTYRCQIRRTILNVIPSICWLSNYNWKDDFIKDVTAGCTVAIMNIPQGMAYALLANVPPVVGIYMAFFPVLVYTFFGTSRHISMGSFAVVCLMTGKIVLQYSNNNSVNSSTNSTDHLPSYTPTEVATAVSFMAGVFQIFMYICRLGVISSLLSETLISGFTAGAAIHVFTSQIKDLFGFKIGSYAGFFQNIDTYVDIFRNLSTINWAATTISLITVLILILNNNLLKPWIKKWCLFPVPIELIIVLIGTILSQYCSLSHTYDVKVIGYIQIGIPEPKPPPVSIMSNIASESLVIAIIAYIISVSMAMIFAQKNKYEIKANQEFLAQGLGNIVGSFFSCAPFAASLSRSVIQETVGGKTQLASLVSCSILIAVLMWIAPFFEPLPRCVLASLIIVALSSLLMQITALPQIWKLSILDGLVWIITYLTVVIVGIDVGLLVGLCFSIISLLIQGMKPYTCLLSRVPGTDIYVDKAKYNQTLDPSGGKIIRYTGGINFANRGYFKNDVYNLLNIRSKDILHNDSNKIYSIDTVYKVRYVIIDISGIHYIDPSGAKMIRTIAEEFREMKIPLYIAGTSDTVYDNFKTNNLMETNLFLFFPTIHDAVLYAQYTLSINPVL